MQILSSLCTEFSQTTNLWKDFIWIFVFCICEIKSKPHLVSNNTDIRQLCVSSERLKVTQRPESNWCKISASGENYVFSSSHLWSCMWMCVLMGPFSRLSSVLFVNLTSSINASSVNHKCCFLTTNQPEPPTCPSTRKRSDPWWFMTMNWHMKEEEKKLLPVTIKEEKKGEILEYFC